MRFWNFLIALVLMPTLAMGGVNLKNGNFYISYTDIIVPGGGQDLSIVRTYNSKSTEKGWFGFGWGSEFETFLKVSADGSVSVYENGAGSVTRFTPKEEVNVEAAADKIIEAMRKRSTLSDRVAADFKTKFINNAELRTAYARKFDVAVNLAAGTELFSNNRGIQKLKKTSDGFVRSYNDGKQEYFNSDGKLVRIQDKNGYKVDLNYDKDGHVASIKDSSAKQLHFEWYSDGHIKHISSTGDRKASYKYQNGNLVESTDIGGNTFKFDYDTNHNMTSVGYKDGSKMVVKYTPQTQFVAEVIERDGASTKYDYGSNPKNPDNHYWTTVTKKAANEKPVENRYEYEIKVKPDGSQYTYRILTVVNGVKTETIYSECCSLPLKITRGNHTTNFEYNAKGLLTKKSSSKGELVELEYHPQFNKITKVSNGNNQFTVFEYDGRGNLKKARNSEGKSVLLIYDGSGKIMSMLDKDEKTNKTRKLSFDYNAQNKPVKISMENVGTINVEYDNYGEIKRVESKAGHKMALQVTQAFQSLLAIVKPAGVNLNM